MVPNMSAKNTVELKITLPAHKLRQLADYLDKLLSDKPSVIIDKQPPTEVEPKLREETPAEKKIELGKSSNGMLIPWDQRIHNKNRNKTSLGAWRIKPKIDRENLLPHVESELIEAMGEIAEPDKDGTIHKFTDLLPLVQAAKASGLIDDDKINKACSKLKLDKFADIVLEPALVPKMAKLLDLDR